VPPEDPDAFDAALDELIDDPAGRAAMGESGRRFVEAWVSPAAVGEAYERLFEELCERRATRRSSRRRARSGRAPG
jgi:glycosyltransferase involved in cell wall biosynthesis